MDNKAPSAKPDGKHSKKTANGVSKSVTAGKHAVGAHAASGTKRTSTAALKASTRTSSSRTIAASRPAASKKTASARKKASPRNSNTGLICASLAGIGVLAAALAVWFAMRSGSGDAGSAEVAANFNPAAVQATEYLPASTATPHVLSQGTVQPLAQEDEPDDFVDEDDWDEPEQPQDAGLNLFAEGDEESGSVSGELLVFDLTPSAEPTAAAVPTPTSVPTPTPKPVKLDHTFEIEVDKSKQVVTVYTVGEEGYYDLIVKQFICSTGHCDKVEDGWYKIGEKSRWKKMGNGSYAQFASRISGPYLFHSGCYYEQRNSQLKVRYYENLGTNASSGCIRLTCGDAYWIYTNCPKGTPIHVITSGVRDEELLEALKPPALINQRYDPTDPETPAKYQYKPETEPTPDPTPVPGVTPAPTPKWTIHPTLKAWGYC